MKTVSVADVNTTNHVKPRNQLEERQAMFGEIMEEAKFMAKERGNNYDCIIPVAARIVIFRYMLLKKFVAQHYWLHITIFLIIMLVFVT